VSPYPVKPATMTGSAIRAPTIMPAPNVAVLRPVLPSHAIELVRIPPVKPVNMPEPNVATERRSSTGSVSARRMLATARPDG